MNLSRFIRQQWRIYQQHQRRQAYRDYLKSDDWQHVRKIKLQFADHLCEQCRRPASPGNPLDVHHLTYDRFGGDELLTDLQVLCRECHEAAHGRKFGVGYPERDMYIEYRTFES